MSLQPGTRLGNYEIISALGAGGMGEVFRARDTKLGREVAIKVLPEDFSRDKERLARFEREARLLAALNHTNIATLYGLEESVGKPFLVMELVQGETLADRIARGPIPVEEAIPLFVQIAEGLEAAHERGIIHRDLKPSNIKFTREGKPKILDFGLAKVYEGEASPSTLSESPTATRGTEHGVIFGTASYMSPEQARGKSLDRRTDIWSFGCVFYEALTGRKCFEDETVSDTIAKILTQEPDFSALPARTHRSVRLLIQRCLEKETARRLRHLDPVQIKVSSEEVVPDRDKRRALVPYLVSAFIAGFTVWFLKPESTEAPRPIVRSVISLPVGERLAGQRPGLAFSPDGNQLAYAAIRGGVQQIYVRALSELQAKPMVGTEGVELPFFSPDGEWLGFFADGKLKKIFLRGGPALTLTDASSPMGGSWGPHDSIVFAPREASGLSMISATGSELRRLTTPDSQKGEEGHLWPEFLPGGRALIFTLRKSGSAERLRDSSGGVALYLLDEDKIRILIPDAGLAHYAPSGHLVYKRAGAIFVASFDTARLEMKGPSLPLGEGMKNVSTFSMSSYGSLVYESGNMPRKHILVSVDRRGAENYLPAAPSAYFIPRLSPDRPLVAVGTSSQDSSGTHVWVYDISHDSGIRLTFDSFSFSPRWSPDGKHIAFRTPPTGRANAHSVRSGWSLLQMSAEGTGSPKKLFESDYEIGAESWTPDGRFLIFFQAHPETDGDIWVLPLDGEGKPQPIIQTSADEGGATISPDGRYLAYVSNESGRAEVYVQGFPGPGGKRQVSTEGGMEPVWGRSREIFYRNADKMMAVSVETEPTFTSTKPRVLFEDPYVKHGWFIANYDVTADGEQFLMLKSIEDEEPAQLVVVQNWQELLKRSEP